MIGYKVSGIAAIGYEPSVSDLEAEMLPPLPYLVLFDNARPLGQIRIDGQKDSIAVGLGRLDGGNVFVFKATYSRSLGPNILRTNTAAVRLSYIILSAEVFHLAIIRGRKGKN